MDARTGTEEQWIGSWQGAPTLGILQQMASGWRRDQMLGPSHGQNLRFLSLFGMHLMNQFWFEEKEMERAEAIHRHEHRCEHHHLARILRSLISDLQHRLERTRQIDAFLRIWQLHHELPAGPKVVATDLTLH